MNKFTNQKSLADNINISIGGDFCLRNNKKPIPPPKEISDISSKSDLFIVNLECPLTTSSKNIQKIGPCIKGSPKNSITLLKKLGVNLVCLANNHIRDFGQKGIQDTLNLCHKNQIQTVGAGASLNNAHLISYHSIKNREIAIINVAENEFASATEKRGGANPFDIIRLLSDIREARENANHVLLILHGGLEHSHYPSPQSVRMLRFLAEQGLTAIVRHHTHSVQGYEIWKDVPIFYSLGNFLIQSLNKSRLGWFEGIVVTLSVNKEDKCTFEIHPFDQCKHELGQKMLDNHSKKAFMKRLDNYSAVICSPEKLQEKWATILKDKKLGYYGLLNMPNEFLFRVFRKLNLLKYIIPNQKKRLRWENIVRCEAHWELLVDILENDSQ